MSLLVRMRLEIFVRVSQSWIVSLWDQTVLLVGMRKRVSRCLLR